MGEFALIHYPPNRFRIVVPIVGLGLLPICFYDTLQVEDSKLIVQFCFPDNLFHS